MSKTRTLYTTSKRIGYVVVCCPDENIKAIRFDQSQAGAYSLCSERGGRTATVFPTRRAAKRAANAIFERDSNIGWFTVFAVGMQETSRVRK